MANYDDVNTPMVAMIGFLGCILIFAIVVFLTVIYHSALDREKYAKDTSQPYTELDNLLASQRIKLVEYRWIDEKNHVVAIPIDRAMQLVVDEHRGGRSTPQAGSQHEPAHTP
jgi:hypothetical protein